VKLTPKELALVAKVRADFESGVAQARHERLHVSDNQLSAAIGAPLNTVGRWVRRERRPGAKYALRYARVIELLEQAVEG
jgi:DNA-binding transcriptional regulator YiaG